MKRLIALSLSLCLLCGWGVYAAAEERNGSAGSLTTGDLSDYAAGEVLVGYTDGTYRVLSYEDDAGLAAALEELSLDEQVSLIQPNYSYVSTGLSADDALSAQQWALYNDGSFVMQEQSNRFPVYDRPFDTPSAPGQWIKPGDFGQPGGGLGVGMTRGAAARVTSAVQQTTAVSGIDINVQEAWSRYESSRDVVIALIDTGVDRTHEELADSIWVNEDEIAGNGIDDDGNGYIDDVYGWNFYSNNNRVYVGSEDDHGTHGAGTIAAQADNETGIAGIVSGGGVKIMIVKALGGSEGSGSTASIIKAIRYAEANGASICNLSLGSTTNDRALYQAIADSSMLFVVAAGNDGADTDSTPCYPAAYDLDNIISVANLNYDGSLHYSSNYGVTSVDLAAPGSYILSTTTGGGYSYMTGTSMAAPMVTGAAAMLYSCYANLTLADVKDVILASAEQLDTLSGSVRTGGMLDLGAAMSWDMDSVSGRDWNGSENAGTAPEITVQVLEQRGTTYVYVRVTDDDLLLTAYGQGTLTARDFQQGTAGTAFQTGGNGTAVFTASAAGTYTFYALDAGGNEAVQTVTIQVRSADPIQSPPAMPGRGWDFARHGQHRFGR